MQVGESARITATSEVAYGAAGFPCVGCPLFLTSGVPSPTAPQQLLTNPFPTHTHSVRGEFPPPPRCCLTLSCSRCSNKKNPLTSEPPLVFSFFYLPLTALAASSNLLAARPGAAVMRAPCAPLASYALTRAAQR